MPAIRLAGFRGEQPRIHPRMLGENGAQAAVNARLDDGVLTPTHAPAEYATADDAEHQTIYKWGSTWLSWADVVHAVPGPVADDRLYFTGDGVPKLRVGVTDYALALAPPSVALTATLGGVGSGDVVTRVYVYTWVTDFGEESEPSPPSAAIDWKPGNTVDLSGFALTPASRNITKQRIYRSQTGQSGTGLYLIAERAASNGNYSDSVAVTAFQEPLPSADWTPPPDGLAGLTAMPNGMLVAFNGRELCFSEPWIPHAWPDKYRLTVDSDIIGLAVNDSTVFVTTKANPYVAFGSHPASMAMKKSKANLPCINARGIADLGFAACYPSNEGLVLVRADGSAGYCSAALFSRDDWLKINPGTLIAGQHLGRYVAFYASDHEDVAPGAVIIDVASDLPFLTRDAAEATAAYFDVPSGGLYYLKKGTDEIWRLDDPNAAPQQLYWRSKQFVLPYPENFGAIQIDAEIALTGDEQEADAAARAAIIAANEALLVDSIEGEINGAELNALALAGDILAPLPYPAGHLTVGVFADGVKIDTIDITNRATRLKSGFSARTWEIDVIGDLSVSQIVMAKTMDELGQVP